MKPVTLLLTGDVMTGRGIDQALACPGDPQLFEASIRDARRYVALSESAPAAFARPLSPADIWGDALAEMDRGRPGLVGLRMVPVRVGRFRRWRAGPADAAWLADTLSATSARFGCGVVAADDGTLSLRW